MLRRKWYNHLAQIRRNRGLSNKEFVCEVRAIDDRLDIGLLSKIENDYVIPKKDMVAVFAKILGCNAADLFPPIRY